MKRTELQTLKNTVWILRGSGVPLTPEQEAFVQKLEQFLGNPHYTPYQVRGEEAVSEIAKKIEAWGENDFIITCHRVPRGREEPF